MALYDRIDTVLNRNPRYTFLAFSALILVAFLVYCWWVDRSGYLGEAESFNFAYADAIFHGVAPYTPYGDLRWEYPPLAYLTFLLPRVFTDDPHTYVYLFGLQIAAFCIIGLALLMRIANRLNRSYTPLIVIFVMSIFALNYFVFDRFDMIVAVLSIGAVYLYTTKKYGWAVLLIVIGMFIKLYPAILLPALLIPMVADGRYRLAGKQLLLFVILTVVIIAPFIVMAPENVWNFLSYHSDRGIQIESVASSFILLAQLYGFTTVGWDFSFGSYNIHGGVADAIVPVMMPLMVIMIVLAYVLFFLWCRNNKEGTTSGVVFMAAILVMFFVIFNKVFSAQYVVWITLPVIMAYAYRQGTPTRNMLIAVILMNVLTYAMVKTSSDLMNDLPVGIWLLFIRNLLVIVMTVVMIHDSGLLNGLTDRFHIHRDSEGDAS